MKRIRKYSRLSDGSIRTIGMLEFESDEDRNPVRANIRTGNLKDCSFFHQPVNKDGLRSKCSINYSSSRQHTIGPISKRFDRIYKYQSVIKATNFASRFGTESLGSIDQKSTIINKSMLPMFTEYIERKTV